MTISGLDLASGMGLSTTGLAIHQVCKGEPVYKVVKTLAIGGAATTTALILGFFESQNSVLEAGSLLAAQVAVVSWAAFGTGALCWSVYKNYQYTTHRALTNRRVQVV